MNFKDHYGNLTEGWLMTFVIGGILAFFALLCGVFIASFDETVWIGPVNHCVVHEHHNNHAFGIGNTVDEKTVYCEQPGR